MADFNKLYLGKIDVAINNLNVAINKLNAAKKVIETGMPNPRIQGTEPEEIFNFVMNNLHNPENNQDGGAKKTKRRSTQKKIKKKKIKKNL